MSGSPIEHPDPIEPPPVVLSHLRCPVCEREWLVEGDLSNRDPGMCCHCRCVRPGLLGVHRPC